MKLHLASDGGKNHFTGHGEGYVAVNHQRYDQALVVTPDAIYAQWHAGAFADLDAGQLQFLLTLKPEIIILGTGPTQRFLQPALLRDFANAQIGVEMMATPAACRTYNILLAENRAVIAAVLLA